MSPEILRKSVLTLKVIVLLKPYCYQPLTYVFLLVHPAHLVAVLLDSDEDSRGNSNQSIFSNVISRAGGDPLSVRRALLKALVRLPVQEPAPVDINMARSTMNVLEEARNIQRAMKDDYIAVDHLILALIKDSTIAGVLKEAAVSSNAIKTDVEKSRGNKHITSRSAEAGFDALAKYAMDMTKLAEEV